MPVYSYLCTLCDEGFEVKHRMNIILDICELCGVSGSIKKTVGKINNPVHMENKIGDLVKRSIDEAKTDLHSDKKTYRKDII
jgi:putative FmdB family regulatory protein